MSSKPIILVTGGTGYVGSHVVQQLLQQKKYVVRATARQTNKLISTFPDAGPDLQVVHVPSLTADHSEVLRGVWALIHCAAPIPPNSTGKVIFDGAYDGAINVVQDAIKAGVKKIVVTGSIVNLLDPDHKTARGQAVLSDRSWGVVNSVDDIDFENGAPSAIYMQAKTLSEKKIWALAHENPDVDVTVLIPPLIAGPFVPNFSTPADKPALGSIGILYALITGNAEGGPNTYPAHPSGWLIDVRDCAKTHLLSLSTPPLKGRDKRFLTELPNVYTWKDIADVLRNRRPELANRLPPKDAPEPPALDAPHDRSLTEQVLGFKNEDYITFEKTIVDTFDELVSWEKKVNKSA